MDLMEFSMTEGNDTLTGDENFLPPQLTQTPVVVNSILKPSTKGNLMQLHTPKPQPKNLKVKFETPHSVKKVTPTRYEQIADLDEKENWIERTTIVTKTDHNLNIEYAKDILNNVVENLPLSKSETTMNKPGNESDDEETFFDAKEETEKATSDICRHPASGPDITPPVPKQTIDSTPATQQVDHALPMSVVSGATGILDVSMECAETDDLRNEEKMECDETVIDTTVICNNTLIENKVVGEEMIQDNPVTMVTSPPLQASKGAYTIDFDNLDSCNPFHSKSAVSNSPVFNVETHGKVDSIDKIVPEEVPIQSGKEESVFDSQILEGLLDIKAEAGADLLSEMLPDVEVKGVYNIDFDDKADPFATKSQVKNSPVSAKPVQTQLQAHDKDVSIEETTVDDDPFSKKCAVSNSPVLIDDDPFSTKSNVVNSPIQATVLGNSNPFATKANVCNSPILPPVDRSSGCSQMQTSDEKDDVEKLSSKSDSATLPLPESNMIRSSTSFVSSDVLNSSNPFLTKTNVVNSPMPGASVIEGNPLISYNKKSPGSLEILKTANTQSDEEKTEDLKLHEPGLSTRTSSSHVLTASESAVKGICDNDSNTDKYSAPAKEEQDGTMLLLGNDPSTLKSDASNSPLPSTTLRNDPLADLDPFTTKSKVPNSPAPPATSAEDPIIDPFTTKSKVANSPAHSATSAEDPMFDPFTTKAKVANSPAPSATSAEDTKSDPFTTKSKVANSPAPSATSAEDPMSDPFTTKAKVANSPAPSATSAEDTMPDPFTTKSKIANSPAPSATSAEDPMSDPFTTKSKVANSPAPSATSAEDTMPDPFTTKSKVANSPAPSATSAEDPMSDPFTTKSKVANSPAPSATSAEDTMSDPFTTKSKVANSPAPSATSAEDPMSDPFTTKAKVANSPAPSATSDVDPMIDPFTTKSKVANSPAPSATSAEDSMSDPFTTKSKVANSPAHSAANSLTDPFATKSKVSNSPSHQAPSSEVPNLPSQTVHQGNGPSSSGNETTEAKLGSRNVESAGSVPDFSEEEFRPATECIFNDTGFLDVLEKFGSSNNESKVSDLARMSLYVKFDPLVDLPASDPRRASTHLLKRASILNMPRRSLSGKSLSDVCNSEENMLLMGTPPKQLSQHLANLTSRSHHTGFTPGSIPTTPKAFKPQLDLLCANTPPRSVKKSTTPAPVKTNSNLPEDPVDNLAGGSDDNIVEVLQYTDKDMCEMKTSLFLEFQGQKLLLDREWNKVVDKLKAKIEEQNQTLENKQADIKLIGNFSKELENIVEGLIQEKESTKTVTEELQKERDQAVQDTQSLEKAFSELHRRNENLKEALSGYVKNQEILTSHAKELQKTLTAVKTESKEKVTELTQQLAKAKSDLNLLTTSSEARARRDKLQLESLQKTVDQKMSENKELTQMCDDLLAKVSS
ncbi:transforming acidic coiled-coil-containing protein 3-like [Ylistrum balloti]|uniref:transforming acidic coiled-coil-containing protein 3-like n=1 Tax=Ylistrum balloti TaxID=509963 RepID=UPI002905A59A|nr:transforming acidic coiled-coil-containing protein 3-like [Ylistrum balloti]